MQYRPLGKTNLKVSTVALGCWQFGGGKLWGEQTSDTVRDIVHTAIDAGINLFDTAEGYGDGRSEEMLGKAIGHRRDEVLIATKVGKLSAEYIATACENSLKRLGTDVIDLYQIHWPRHVEPLEETMGALEKLRAQGKIRVIGVSNFGPNDFDELTSVGRAESNQFLYSMLCRMMEDEVTPRCVQHDVSILCYSPLAQGLLADRWRSIDEVPPLRARNRLFSCNRPHTSHNEPGCETQVFEALDQIRTICRDIGQPMGTVALAWCLHQRGVASVLAGARNPAQVTENARAAEIRIDDPTRAQLNAATDMVKSMLCPNLDIISEAARSALR